jgi:hypothetical protein
LPAAQGLQGLLAAHGLHGFLAAHGLHGFFAAQGLQGLHGFLAAHGLHGFLAAHGLQGLGLAAAHGLALAAVCRRGTAQALLAAPPPAAHGLQGLFAAHGLQGLHGFLAAQGLQGLHGLAFLGAHWAAAGFSRTTPVIVTPVMATPAATTSGTIVVDSRIRLLVCMGSLPDRGPHSHPAGWCAGPRSC